MGTHGESVNFTFPEWERPYLEAVLETDQSRLEKKLREAEAAMQNRLQAPASSSDVHAEREAIEAAMKALAVLKQERLSSD